MVLERTGVRQACFYGPLNQIQHIRRRHDGLLMLVCFSTFGNIRRMQNRSTFAKSWQSASASHIPILEHAVDIADHRMSIRAAYAFVQRAYMSVWITEITGMFSCCVVVLWSILR